MVRCSSSRDFRGLSRTLSVRVEQQKEQLMIRNLKECEGDRAEHKWQIHRISTLSLKKKKNLNLIVSFYI